ncbi:MAG: SpoVR family protein [Alphaproteobacteria bacterium]|nr:SpoVR family protein [Alphaproteobacteria bacterium]
MSLSSDKPATKLLFEDADWDFPTLSRVYDAIEKVALEDLKLDVYPNQIEVISSEQMLDAYSAHGMPLMYQHWSFGKIFAREETMYRKGYSALAYEIVINANPCISFLMEENTTTMQALVTAHAAFGHNHFFKNNYLFRQWTDAEGILDYLNFAKLYIAKCEESYGHEAVEEILDSAHALMDQGVFRYKRPPRLSREAQTERVRKRLEYEAERFSDLWRTLPKSEGRADDRSGGDDDWEEEARMPGLPEENILYFLEKVSPTLRPWQREILRIVRNIAQYFYPQKQTKVMNEGCATFVHHYIMHALFEQGLINEGSLLEFLHSHTSVVFQPGFDDPRYSGINPYALGFAMMTDIRRICTEPTDEDRDWFPDLAGSQDWRGALKEAWANFRDESFIQQYLSPKVIRDFRFFALHDEENEPVYRVSAIHNEQGYRDVRDALATQYDLGQIEPNIQVVAADLKGDRTLRLKHLPNRGRPLHEGMKIQVLRHVERLWGYNVELATEAAPAPEDE